MAWLQAPIDPPKGRKGAQDDEDRKPRPSRMTQLPEDADPPLPDIEDGRHIIDALMEVGPFVSNGMGPAPVSWQEITAWQTASCSVLEPHELQLLRSLSVEYLGSYEQARAEDCGAPMAVKPKTAQSALALQAKVKSLLRG